MVFKVGDKIIFIYDPSACVPYSEDWYGQSGIILQYIDFPNERFPYSIRLEDGRNATARASELRHAIDLDFESVYNGLYHK